MAWVVKREDSAGGTRFQVRFRDADGVKRSAGTFASRREAVKAGRRIDGKVEDGTWIDPAAGRVTFRDYVEQSGGPAGISRSAPGPATAATWTGTSCRSSATGR
jgi:hypothetical protein